MEYINYEYYISLYGAEIPETDFNRLAWEACRLMDSRTTSLDGVKMLRAAFPSDEYGSESVRRCTGRLVQILYQLEQAEKSAQSAQGYVTREDGTVVSKVVSSVSAGNESISYSAGGSSGTSTRITSAVSDSAARERLLNETVTEYLSGVSDANGVNLLYMGRYPYPHQINGWGRCFV